jgi:hypothetical protein
MISAAIRPVWESIASMFNATFDRMIERMAIASGRMVPPAMVIEYPLVVTEGTPSHDAFDDIKSEQSHLSIGDLLEDMEMTFREIKYPPRGGEACSDPSVFRTLGPMIYPRDIDLVVSPDVPVTTRSSLIFISYGKHGAKEEKDIGKNDCVPSTMFWAQKIEKKSIACAHLKGDVYEAGFVIPWKKGTYWAGFYLSIINDRIVVEKKVPVVGETAFRGKKGWVHLPKRRWEIQPVLARLMEQHGDTIDEAVTWVERISTGFFLAWQWRKDYWRVSARKDGRRVTFLIKERDPKVFFADRDITVRTPTGQKKRILHYVGEFERWVSDDKRVTVKGHLRGLREFSWRGTHCAILAPKFHRLDGDDLTCAAEVIDGPMSKSMISGKTLGKRMAHWEDKQQAR